MFYDIVSFADFTMVVRLVAAAGLGAAIGFERERSGKVAGLRTHALVALGSALFTVISLAIFAMYPSLGGVAGFDYHIIANIVVGIGFIGAGTIIRRDNKIEGTTTAASLWAVAGIGIASGLGLYLEAVAATLIAYSILALLWIIERKTISYIRYQAIEEKAEAGQMTKDADTTR